MYRLLAVAVGLLELLAPRTVLRLFGRLCYRSPDRFEPREWTVHAVKLEGAAIVGLATLSLYKSARGTADKSDD